MTTNRLASVSFLALALFIANCGSDRASRDSDGSGIGSIVPASAGVDRAPVAADAPVDQLSAGFTDAGFELMRTQPSDTNLVLSPLSIGHALLMARGAADENTGSAIDGALSLPDGMSAHEAWNALDAAIADTNGVAEALDGMDSPIVTIADRLWHRGAQAPTRSGSTS